MNPRVAEIAKKLSPEQRAGQSHSWRRSAIRLPRPSPPTSFVQLAAGIFLLGHWTAESKLEAMLSAEYHVARRASNLLSQLTEGGEIQNIRVPGVDHLPSPGSSGPDVPGQGASSHGDRCRQLTPNSASLWSSPPWLASSTLALNKPIAKHHRGFRFKSTLQCLGSRRCGTPARGSFRPLSIFPGIGRIGGY